MCFHFWQVCLFNPRLWCLIWAVSCYTYPLMTNSVSWLARQNRNASHMWGWRGGKKKNKKKGKSIEMLQCLTGLCSRRQDGRGVEEKKKAKHQTVSLAFVFRVRALAVPRQAEDLCMYAGCWCIGEFIFLFFFLSSCLWSLPSFEVTPSEGGEGGFRRGGWKPKQKSPQVHGAN